MKNPCYPNDVLGQWTPNKLRTSGYWIKKIFTEFGAGFWCFESKSIFKKFSLKIVKNRLLFSFFASKMFDNI